MTLKTGRYAMKIFKSKGRFWAAVVTISLGVLTGSAIVLAQQPTEVPLAHQLGLPKWVPVADSSGDVAGYILSIHIVQDPEAEQVDGPFPVVASPNDKNQKQVGVFWGSIGFVSNEELKSPDFSLEKRRRTEGWTPTSLVTDSDG